MWEKIQNKLKGFAGALLEPLIILSLAGMILIVGYILALEFMPESTQVTSGWSQSHLKAHSAALQPREDAAIRCFPSSGIRSTSLPPRNGSMMITGMPRAAAALRPTRPACVCSSR